MNSIIILSLSLIIIIISNYLTQVVNFPTWISDCDTNRLALSNLIPAADPSLWLAMNFPPWKNSNNVVVSVSNDSSIISNMHAPFSHADRDSFCDHVRDVPRKEIIGTSEFKRALVYISLIKSTKSTHIHPDCFRLGKLLLLLKEIMSLDGNSTDLVSLQPSSERMVI